MTSGEWMVLGLFLVCAGTILLILSQILLNRHKKKTERQLFHLE